MLLISAAALVLLPGAGQGAERAKAKVECAPADAKIMVGAEMPSMPMAHNVKPVRARAMDKPGRYHARVQLQRAGEWALTTDLSGPTRDRLVHTQRFGSHEGEPGGMKHGEMKQEG